MLINVSILYNIDHAHDTTWWNLANGCRVPIIKKVGIHTLYKDSLGETFSIYLSTYIQKPNTTCLFNHTITMDVREKAKTETIG